jgi:hypothetical protein
MTDSIIGLGFGKDQIVNALLKLNPRPVQFVQDHAGMKFRFTDNNLQAQNCRIQPRKLLSRWGSLQLPMDFRALEQTHFQK